MDTSITIIGAGVVGLAIASELSESYSDVLIIEKNQRHGMGISSRNSEVIHSGIYYPPESLKGLLCIEGKNMLYETCSKNNIPHKKIGKLIVATSDSDIEYLEKLKANAEKNGVNLSLLDKNNIKKLEPNIKALSAIYSPDTGILNVHYLMDYYLQKAKNNGTDIVYSTEVLEIERITGGYRINTLNSRNEYFSFTTERVINSAGLNSDRIASMVGLDYKVYYCKGDYFSINNVKSDMVNRLIYPVPEKNNAGLGIHLTIDLSGRLKLGPDATYIERVEDYMVDAHKRDRFYEAASRYLPFLKKDDIIPDMSGIRPKLQGPNEKFHDFVIREDIPGFINLIGIESPGLTSAPAIARYVKQMIQ